MPAPRVCCGFRRQEIVEKLLDIHTEISLWDIAAPTANKSPQGGGWELISLAYRS